MIAGYVFIAVGIFIMVDNLAVGIVVSFAGLTLGTAWTGVLIDVDAKKLKQYSQWYGIKSGEWKSMEKYPYLSVLKLQVGYTVASRSNRTLDVPDTAYCVCLLTESHRKKVIIKEADSDSLAEHDAMILSEKLGKELVKYSPVISAQTRARR